MAEKYVVPTYVLISTSNMSSNSFKVQEGEGYVSLNK